MVTRMGLPVVASMVGAALVGVGPSAHAADAVRIVDLICEKAMTRAGRTMGVYACIENGTTAALSLEAALTMPDGVRVVGGEATQALVLAAGEEADLHFDITADRDLHDEIRLEVRVDGAVVAERVLPIRFLPAMAPLPNGYVPEPQPVKSPLLVGAHHCPLWEADKPGMWAQIRKHPDRTPALGFYAQDNPEVADWETTWAVEHGVDFFIYCWYRTSQGGPVQTMFSSAIHDALFKSRYASKMKFTIMWENQSRGRAGVADERDLMENLLPFWIENYFKHDSYLKVDNKPVLFIYRPEFLIDDLGGVENVARAFDLMRQACRDAGFDGLYLLGEYRGLDPNHLQLMKSLGLDYTFAYCWYVPDNPTPEQSIEAQMGYIEKTQELGVLPQVVTVSQAWSGWNDEGSIWLIPPKDFEGLLQQAKDFVATIPRDQLGGRMLLLDNWNEWGEGHYIAPHTDSGFGYLDAVRKVLAGVPGEHVDLIPEDLGMGPYDTAYRTYMAEDRALRRETSRLALKNGSDAPGLVGWWAFDEEPGSPFALDYTGRRQGGKLVDIERVEGIDGSALDCRGGCVVVPSRDSLDPGEAMTVECWIRTDVAGQDNKWLVNRVYQSGDAGYRLGSLRGRPCFEVPQTAWSHHLEGDTEVPMGRWVHLAGTFDGSMMRVYMDGRECGSMERPGPVKACTWPITLGSYEQGHAAFFTGLLDEVRLYNRALSAEEIAAQARPGNR